ncbi:MAG TPA: hypothetical protein VGS11_00050 [Candidatus Bathyarchaeia archaeon]|nr:hypothetical protein [Candidatus Bathyarchaeia archaeon]
MQAARVAQTVDEEPNSDLIEYVAGYAPRSAVYHYFRNMAELLNFVGVPPSPRPLSKILLQPPCFDLASVVTPTAEKSLVHMEDAKNEKRFRVWQKVNGGMRSTVLNRRLHRITFLSGILLYAGEGTKSLATSRVELANSNPGILRLHIKFMKAIGIPATKLRARVQLHRLEEEREAEELWSRELGLNSTQFVKPLLKAPSEFAGRRTFTLQLNYSNTMLLVLLRHWTSNLEDLVEKISK